jgi:NRE family putative nickel resistance protein-like MFS transporter
VTDRAPIATAKSDRLFADANYLRLFFAHVASLLGSGVTSVALAVLAYELTGSNAAVVLGTALMVRILAFVTLSPVAGVLADRVDRRRLLVAADLLRVGLLALFPFVTTVQQIYLLIFAINAVTAFFTPTYEASLPEVVGPRLYTRALSASRVALDVEAAVGPLVAGALITAVGVRWTFWFDAATYLVSAILVLLSRVPRAPAPGEPFPWRRFLPEISYGTRVLLREPALRRALVLHITEAMAGAATIVVTIVYVRDVLGRGDGSFALIMGAAGIGSSVAALLLARRPGTAESRGTALERHLAHHRWAERTMLVGGLLSGVALLPGVFAPDFVLLLLLWAVVGAGGAMIAIPSIGLLAEHTTPDERGRAYSAHFALTHVFWMVAYPAAGYLPAAVGTPWTFTLAGAAALLMVGIAVLMAAPHRAHPLTAVG